MTRAPRARANCTAAIPTLPEAPLMRTVWPPLTPSASSVRTAVSTATGRAAAPAKSSASGTRA